MPTTADVSVIRLMKPSLAVCLDNSAHPLSLEFHKIYRVLPDEDAERGGDLRIVDESCEGYLYAAKNFALIDLPDETERILMDSFGRHVAGSP